MKKYKYIFFDLDGTLTDPFEGITRAVAHALSHFGIDVRDRSELGKFIGPPLRESFHLYYGIPEDRIEEAITVFREYFSTKGIFENELYGKIPETLARLHEQGYVLLIATSKPEVFAKRITEHFEIDKYFFAQCGAALDESRDTKGEVIAYAMSVCGAKADEVLMVGDRSHDIRGAHECSLDAAGVLWGFGSKEELLAADADFIFSDVTEFAQSLLQ